MSSEESWNRVKDETGCQAPDTHRLCANGCGFFGTPATLNLCSKCYRDFCIKEEQSLSAKAAVDKSLNPTTSTTSTQQQQQQSISSSSVDSSLLAPSSSSSSETFSTANSTGAGVVENKKSVQSGVKNRCGNCKKRVGLLGFNCRCGSTFCSEHRYPEKHACTFDFKSMDRKALAKANPVVKADKVLRF